MTAAVLSLALGVLCLAHSNAISAAKQENFGYFWHVTDMHWDDTYRVDEAALSCGDTEGRDQFGIYGDYACDAPRLLVNASVRAMADLKADPDFLIWTGDDTPHIYNDTILNQQVVKDIILSLTDQLLSGFPNSTFYSALGNHDWSPKHQLPPQRDPLYDVIADKWQSWLGAGKANETFRNGGYYTRKQSDAIRMVVLNTNLYYTNNKLTSDLEDPANQLQWLGETLTDAATNGEKVIIIGHVPPGRFEKHADKYWFYPNHHAAFLRLLQQHSDVISGMHFAHHHSDSFRLVKDEEGNVVNALLLAPAVTPWATTLPDVIGGAANNPAIRLIKYDRQTGATLDVYQYYLNLTKANEEQNDTWELLYQGTEYYGQEDMTTSSLASIASQLLEDDALFARYYNANGVAYAPEESCNEHCRKVHFCAITELNYETFGVCMEPSGAAGSVQHSGVTLLWSLLLGISHLLKK